MHDLAEFATVPNIESLIRLAVDLGALNVGGPLTEAEVQLARRAHQISGPRLPAKVAREAILDGLDPLGSAFYGLRSAAERRSQGAVYTPPELVKPMVEWVAARKPSRVVDAGAGSGRFCVDVAIASPKAHLIAVDVDPCATLMTRAALSVVRHRVATVLQQDYTQLRLPNIDGVTGFIGNPPYVRHHNLSPRLKAWAQGAAKLAGHRISGLAGLHAYFYLATAIIGSRGDIGCFVTSSEWLDVNYGSVVRDLLLNGLGAEAIHVLEPEALPFEAATTAAITCFRLGDAPTSLRLRPIKTAVDVDPLEGGRLISRQRLAEAPRWSAFFRTRQVIPDGYIELGELCQVHRGQVTGANSVWVTKREGCDLPGTVLFPSVTRARELFSAGDDIDSELGLRVVIDLPADLDLLDSDERRVVERFLSAAKLAGAHSGYIATHRRTWWSVGLREAAPILATYMARRPPAFVRNSAGVRHINIAHGLYPRTPLPAHALVRLTEALRTSITVAMGRTYAGGLTKFEPKEMERLLVPDLPELLAL